MACFDVMHHMPLSMKPEYFIQENADTGIWKPVLHSREEGPCNGKVTEYGLSLLPQFSSVNL